MSQDEFINMADMPPGAANQKIKEFSFVDIKKIATTILQNANSEAKKMIELAKKQVSEYERRGQEFERQAKSKGYEDGYKDGKIKGEQDGKIAGHDDAVEQFTQTVAPVSDAITKLLIFLESKKTELIANAEADLLRLAIAIAKRIVKREILIDEQYVIPTVKEAIALATERSDILILINPQDYEMIETHLPMIKTHFSDIGKVHLEKNQSVERGGVIVRTRTGEVDLQLEQQLDMIQRALLGEGVNPEFKEEQSEQIQLENVTQTENL